MKRALLILAVVIGVLVVLVIAAPFLIPVNQFRPAIEEKASEALGRKVGVGNMSLSLLSGSLSAENLSIGDDPKFSKSAFLTAKSLKVGVEMMPLILSRSLHVTGVTIENPEVTLLRNSTGLWNYSSLGAAAAKSQPRQTAKTSKPDSSGVPSDVSVQKLELKDGRIIVGAENSQRRSTYDHVNVTATDVSFTSKFPVTVTADLPSGGKFKLDGTAGPIDPEDSSLTPIDAKLNVTSLNLASTGFLDASAGLGGLLDLDATLSSKNGEAETKGTAKLSKALLVAGGSSASVPVTVNYQTRYNLRKGAGILEPCTLKIGNAAAHLNGTYESSGEATVVNIKLDAQNMPAKDLEAFLPALGVNLPKGASIQGGTMNANLTISGPTNKLVTTGNVGLFSAKLAGFDLGAKMAAISALTGVKTGKDLDIEKLTTNLRMAPNGLQAQNFLAVIPSLGNLAGAGTIDSRNNLDFKMVATLINAQNTATGTTGGTAGAAAGGLAGLLGKATGGGGCKNGTTVPFMIQGTASDPKFVPDVGGLAAGLLKSQLGCAGGSGSTASGAAPQQQNNNNPMDALGGLFKKKKPPQ